MKEVVAPTAFWQQQPAATVVELFSQAGITLAEIVADAPGTHIDLTDEQAVAVLAAVMGGLPIRTYAIHSAFDVPSPQAWDISQADQAQRDSAIRGHITILRAGARLGVHHYVIHPGIDIVSDQRLATSHASLQQLAEAAGESGTRIAVENLPPGLLGSTIGQMQQLLDGLDPAIVGFCLDTGHAYLGPDSLTDYIRAFAEQLIAVHWQDNNGTGDDHLFPGTGVIPWEEFFAVLDDVGYGLPVTVESSLPEGMSLPEAVHLAREALAENRAPILPPAYGKG